MTSSTELGVITPEPAIEISGSRAFERTEQSESDNLAGVKFGLGCFGTACT